MRLRSQVLYFCLGICFALSCGSGTDKPVWSEHIAPIVHRNCAPCHRPGQVGHFNLLTYEETKLHAHKIRYTVSNRLMPPWPADPHYTEFSGQMVLSDEEIRMVERWVDQGCAPGDLKKVPPVPSYPEGSFLGKPDWVVPVKPIALKGNATDRFLMIKVPFELPSDTFLRAVEFVPGNTKVVHHVNGDMVRFEDALKKNVFDGDWVTDQKHDSTIQTAYRTIGLLHDDGSYPTMVKSVVNYLPGVIAQQYPDGIGGWKVNKKSAFVMADLHYGPSDEEVWDSSRINLFFAPGPPDRPLQEFQMGTLGVSPIVPPLVIPPGKVSTYRTQLFVPRAISVITVNPHMHLLGKEFLAYALTPERDTIRLIRIPRWNFNWQFFYTFRKMVKIPAGSTIVVEGVFDNTSNNPFNPFNPPQTIRDRDGSMKTTDEMFQFIVNYVPCREGDENVSLERNP